MREDTIGVEDGDGKGVSDGVTVRVVVCVSVGDGKTVDVGKTSVLGFSASQAESITMTNTENINCRILNDPIRRSRLTVCVTRECTLCWAQYPKKITLS
jgi:hypothetical protein